MLLDRSLVAELCQSELSLSLCGASDSRPIDEGVELCRDSLGRGQGVRTTRAFDSGDRDGRLLVGPLTGNDSHATQVGVDSWARHGGLGSIVNHSCDPNCGVRLNAGHAFDFVARRDIARGEEVTFDYAMRNLTIEHFPDVCLCGTAECRGAVTGWRGLPEARSAYGDLTAPYLREIDAAASVR